MKKILSCVLAVVMVASMSVTAFAADSATNTGGETKIPVEGIYVPSDPVTDVISVDIAWEGMNFVYTEGEKGVWQPDKHEYSEGEKYGDYYPDDRGMITVKNHSNVCVSASMTFAASDVARGATPWFGDENEESYYVELQSAEGTAYDSAPSASVSFFVHSWAERSTENTVDIGTVTVTIAQIPHIVSTLESLEAVFARGGDVKLTSNINTNSKTLYVDGVDVNLDLNGHTLSGPSGEETIRVKDGTLTITDSAGGGGLDTDPCIGIERGTLLIRGGYYAMLPFQYVSSWSTVVIEGGTFEKDPSKYVDTENYDVTQNDDGTWTVTAKQA